MTDRRTLALLVTVCVGQVLLISAQVQSRDGVPIVQVAVARFEDYQSVKQERDVAQQKLAERKVVERAKGVLMSKRGMSEDEAYHALRKMAMEKKLRMGEVAERVISMADLLG